MMRRGPAARRQLCGATAQRAQRHAPIQPWDREETYRSIVELQTELVARLRPDGRLTFVNQAFSDHLGLPQKDLPGRSFFTLFREADLDCRIGAVAALTTAHPTGMFEAPIDLPDGTAAWFQWIIRGIFDAADRLVELQAVGRDVTERRRELDAERQRNIVAEVLGDTATAMNRSLDLDEVLDQILADIAWIVPHDAAMVLLVEDYKATILRSRGLDPSKMEKAMSLPLDDREREIFGRILKAQSSVVMSDSPSTGPCSRSELKRFPWARSVVCTPLGRTDDVVGSLVLLSAQPGSFSRIQVEIIDGFARHAGAAIRNAQLYQKVSESRAAIRALSIRMIESVEAERRRISRELHDELGQALTAMIMSIDMIEEELASRCSSASRSRLKELSLLSRRTLDQVRELSLRLRPASLDEAGLVSTLRWLTRTFSRRTAIDVDLEIAGLCEEQRFEPAVEITIYRVVQEALTNVARHASTRKAKVSLFAAADAVIAGVSDCGCGFDSDGLANNVGSLGLGLVGLRERVENLQGVLIVDSAPGRGTHLEVAINCPSPAAEEPSQSFPQLAHAPATP